MIDEKLLQFVKLQVENGVSRDLVVDALLQNGWRITDINNAYSAVNENIASMAVTRPLTPITPRSDQSVVQNSYTQNQPRQSTGIVIKILTFFIILMIVTGLGLFIYLKYFNRNILSLVESVPVLKDLLNK